MSLASKDVMWLYIRSWFCISQKYVNFELQQN